MFIICMYLPGMYLILLCVNEDYIGMYQQYNQRTINVYHLRSLVSKHGYISPLVLIERHVDIIPCLSLFILHWSVVKLFLDCQKNIIFFLFSFSYY